MLPHPITFHLTLTLPIHPPPMNLPASRPRFIQQLFRLRLKSRLVSVPLRAFLSAMVLSNGMDKAGSPPKKLKILMLHGYTQSGDLFRAKTRALERILLKAFTGTITLSYPTAPIRLLPADIPGFSSPDTADPEKPDARGWWKRDADGTYTGLEAGLQTIADAIKEMGGIDGVVGFSQGAAAAALVASLLEPGRPSAFSPAFPYPASFASLPALHPNGLKFAVSYCGFRAPHQLYAPFYSPKISTPVLHVIGSLDSVVEESSSLALVEACEKSTTVYHPGGHFVPIGKDMAGVLVGFLRECCEEKLVVGGRMEDMDVPF